MFAKLFGPPDAQLLVKFDAAADTGKPEVRVFFEPPGLGVCSVSVAFEDSEEGWANAEHAFEEMDESRARSGAAAAMRELSIVVDGMGY
jgi:hypothetical protein